MKQIYHVFRFTFLDGVRKKSFIISTVIIALFVLAMFSVPAILSAVEKSKGPGPAEPVEPAEQPQVCYYIDAHTLIPGGAEKLAAAMPHVNVVAADKEEFDSLRELVRSDGAKSIVLVEKGVSLPVVEVYNKDFLRGVSTDGAISALSEQYVENALRELGMPDEGLELLGTKLTGYAKIVDKMDVSGYIVGIIITMLMYFAIYFYGYGVAMSVATEKTSRVMETLIVSAKPSRVLYGKCIAMGLVGLSQLAFLLAFGAVCYRLLVPDDFLIMGMPLAFSSFSLSSALLIILYFILGYMLYALMNAVCGASVSRIEDVNTAMMPVVFLTMAAFFMSYFGVIASGGGGFARFVTIFPLTSPFAIPYRLLNETVPAGDIAVSLALLIVSIAVVAFFSVKIYSASVLHYGKRLKLRAVLKAGPQERG